MTPRDWSVAGFALVLGCAHTARPAVEANQSRKEVTIRVFTDDGQQVKDLRMSSAEVVDYLSKRIIPKPASVRALSEACTDPDPTKLAQCHYNVAMGNLKAYLDGNGEGAALTTTSLALGVELALFSEKQAESILDNAGKYAAGAGSLGGLLIALLSGTSGAPTAEAAQDRSSANRTALLVALSSVAAGALWDGVIRPFVLSNDRVKEVAQAVARNAVFGQVVRRLRAGLYEWYLDSTELKPGDRINVDIHDPENFDNVSEHRRLRSFQGASDEQVLKHCGDLKKDLQGAIAAVGEAKLIATKARKDIPTEISEALDKGIRDITTLERVLVTDDPSIEKRVLYYCDQAVAAKVALPQKA